MKTIGYLHALALVATATLGLSLASCNSSAVGSVMQAAGIPGEVMLVMDGPSFESQAAHDIVNTLERPAPSLPQEEPTLQVTSLIPKAGFDGMIRRARNIVIVDIDRERFGACTLHPSYDEWAKGQLVLRLTSPSLDSVSTYVRANAEAFTNLIVRHELYRQALITVDDYSQKATEYTDSIFGHRITVPRDIRNHKFAPSFLWMSNAQMRQRHDLLVYSFPYRSSRDLELDRLVEVRDSVLKANIKGEFEGTYPSTVRSGLYYRKVNIPGQPIRGEVRGLWQMEGGAMMGGPFVQQAYADRDRGLVFVVEGFVYHPNEDKLTLIRAMEAALYSFRPASQREFAPKVILGTTYSKMQ